MKDKQLYTGFFSKEKQILIFKFLKFALIFFMYKTII